MKREPLSHLSPEIFVDVLEGSPVDARWHAHLEICSDCRHELDALGYTLSLLTDNAGGEESSKAPRRLPTWVVTAAAVLALAVGVSWLIGERAPGTSTTLELRALLPPVEEDEEFQLLRALSDANDVELAEVAAQAFDGLELDPSPLTPGERQRFVERLTEEMGSSL